MIKALIIEDEKKAADMLQIMIEKNNDDVKVLDKCYDLPSGVRSIRTHQPDIVFLDIEMPGYSGLQLLEFFNEDEIDFSIIFTTAFNDYALKAFDLSAIDYILKPIQIDKLNSSIEKYRKKRHKQNEDFQKLTTLKHNLNHSDRKIALPISSGVEIVNVSDIRYLQAEGSYSKFFLSNDKQLVISKNLKFFEELVGDDAHFFRVHRSYIVNINYIKKVLRTDGGTIILNDNTELPIVNDKIDNLIKLLS